MGMMGWGRSIEVTVLRCSGPVGRSLKPRTMLPITSLSGVESGVVGRRPSVTEARVAIRWCTVLRLWTTTVSRLAIIIVIERRSRGTVMASIAVRHLFPVGWLTIRLLLAGLSVRGLLLAIGVRVPAKGRLLTLVTARAMLTCVVTMITSVPIGGTIGMAVTLPAAPRAIVLCTVRRNRICKRGPSWSIPPTMRSACSESWLTRQLSGHQVLGGIEVLRSGNMDLVLRKDGLETPIGKCAVGMTGGARVITDALVPVGSYGICCQSVQDISLVGWTENQQRTSP